MNGSGFVLGSVVNWNAAARTTAFVNSTTLTATIPATDITTAGTAQVTVFSPTPGGGTSGQSAFTISSGNPVPVVSSLSPASATAGGAQFTLTVNGSSFVSGAAVQWNGSPRTTSFASATQLNATIPATDITAAGTAQVGVTNPTPGGGASTSTQTFTIDNPTPVMSGLSPSSVPAGGAQFTLTVSGASFVNGATVQWNGSNRTTTFINATQLTATIPASDITAQGTAQITVVNPAPAVAASSAFSLNIVTGSPVPVLTSISPTSAGVGGAQFTLTANGSGFVNGSFVVWNGAGRTTTFVSTTQVTALIPATDLAAAGNIPVTVFTAGPGGGTSAASTFTINNPTPEVSGISPSSAAAGSSTLTLTVSGLSGLVPTSVVQWNGAGRPTTYVNSSQLTAQIPSSDLATAGSNTVTVFNPAPGGGTSFGFPFSVRNPAPVIASLNPSTASANGDAFVLAVSGSGFVPASVVQWNGANRATNFVSGTVLQAQVLASDLVVTGSGSVTAIVGVVNPTPGGGTATANFTIAGPPQGSVTVASSSGGPGGALSIPVSLTLSSGVSVSGLSLGIHITPNGNAPALSSSLGFTASPSLPSPYPTASTTDIGVLWTSFATPLSGTVTLGNLVVPVPASAVVGQTYTLQVTGPGGSLNSTSISLSPGPNGTLTVAILTYLVGDVFPFTGDTAPAFGDNVLNTLDLITQLRAVAGQPGQRPPSCSDRYDAMDTYPVDGSNDPNILAGRPGGDGALNTLDLLTNLRRVTDIDLSRPTRTQRGLACLSSQAPAARREPQGPPEGTLEIVNGDVYVRADRDVSLSGLAFSLGSAAVGSNAPALRWTAAESLAPSLLDSSTPGALAVAWLEGVTLRGGERLRLGRVDGSASLTVYGISANESEKAGGREVRLVGRAEK